MKKFSIAIPLSLLPLLMTGARLPAQQASGEPPVSNARLETLAPTAGFTATLQIPRR